MKNNISFKSLALTLVLASLGLVSCTDNYRAKMMGGTMKIELEKGQKLVDVTWKETSLWYMTKPMNSTDVPETYTFKEDSSWDVIEGTVIFIESK
jgi:hypothetical protein